MRVVGETLYVLATKLVRAWLCLRNHCSIGTELVNASKASTSD